MNRFRVWPTLRSMVAGTIVVATLTLLAGCDSHDYRDDTMRSETRDVAPFDAVEMNGSVQLEIKVGEPASIVLRGPDRAIELTSTEVHEGTLRIRTSRKDLGWTLQHDGRLTVVVSVPQLKSVRLQGGNDVRITGFQGGATTIDVEGAARVRASGELDQLTVAMQGAGFADLGDLMVNEAQVTVDGIGQVIVHPKNTLDATLNGVGAIFYEGSPQSVNTHMNGIGTISQRDNDHAARKLRKEQRQLDKERRRQERDSPDENAESQSGAPPQIDPDKLQPERDNRSKEPVSITKVI